MFSLECHRDNDSGPMEKDMYFQHITWLFSERNIHKHAPVRFHCRKTTEKVLSKMGLKTEN